MAISIYTDMYIDEMEIDKNKIILEISEASYLRPINESDITEKYIDGLNDSEVNRFLVGPRSQEQTIDTVKNYVNDNWYSSNAILFGFYVADDLSGTVRLHDINNDTAYIGIAIFNKEMWGHGWGKKIIASATEYAIYKLGLDILIAGIEKENYASQRIFTETGYMHDKSFDKKQGVMSYVYRAH